jgi:hypothetical protein
MHEATRRRCDNIRAGNDVDAAWSGAVQRSRLGLGPVGGIPHLGRNGVRYLVGYHGPAGPHNAELISIDRAPNLDELPETVRRNGVAHGVPFNERQHLMHPTGLDVVGIQTRSRRRTQETAFSGEAFRGGDTGAAMDPAVSRSSIQTRA